MRRFKRVIDNTNDNTRKNNDPKKQIAMYALNKIILTNVINIPHICLLH
jgi:hypothetical protein